MRILQQRYRLDELRTVALQEAVLQPTMPWSPS
ncbi:hypothetical protein GAR06_00663 [Micromonospora saelicesensis]|uniref:Uncharacterized protein n=1 Tax=Micromonospora saelicesensis TaxID=285676 RepID=A0ABX9CM74_9ACTN|nr:hypothetical protein GAR05_01529 [Micromonospora saelicesensis]RAO41927.1 hypothetical protein PSN01_06361 [Micromonospora saelicesensis]RAO50150.1 hypothetical protein GAR06_00663 [Micromonospora saelicesensis]RAO57133.1 hypothetical protein LUPAC06_03321 [Micromonospora saelicesensis]